MPKKTKEQELLEKKTKAKVKKEKTSTSNAKKVKVDVKNDEKKAKSSVKKAVAKKKTSSSKNKTTKVSTTTTTNKPKKKSTTKKTTSKKKIPDIVEYYDLPNNYNTTVVKVLAQTPTSLFVYWEISDADKKAFEEKYGNNFFHTTKPILIIHNKTANYTFEVEINDFANSWYLPVNDSKCEYTIELGRKPISKNENIKEDYIHISSSNNIESPNDRILFDNNQKMAYFSNVKTGKQSEKPTTSLSFIKNIGKIYNIYDLYKEIYETENIEQLYDLSNPSS